MLKTTSHDQKRQLDEGRISALYQDEAQPIDVRIDDLVTRMTLEEKAHELANDAPANERLGIPKMTHGEILHGVMWKDQAVAEDPERYAGVLPTIFPQSIAIACSFDPDLLERTAAATAREARSLGKHHCYSPTLDVACDIRFGRIEETYGEDPYLVSRMGVACINGFQGRGAERFDQHHVLATAKHFVAYGIGRGGLNGGEVDIGERALREIHLKPFAAAIREAGVAGIMPSHHCHDGIPCHGNTYLLRDVLRCELGFQGLIVSDNSDIYRLFGMHHVAVDEKEAAIQAVAADINMDVCLGPRVVFKCYRHLPELVAEGRIDEGDVDRLLRRVLRAKFELGLFDDPETEDPKAVCLCPEHRSLALEAARSSQVLLANDGLLPLDAQDDRALALIGPHAEICSYGGYVAMTPAGVSTADALRGMLSDSARLTVERGCGFGLDDDPDDDDSIANAVANAQAADLVILALGGIRQTTGEGRDNSDIRLPGRQHELAHAVLDCGKPTILLLIGGRPWAIGDISSRCNAVLLAWYGGVEAGTAIAETLLGVNNPGGKLSVSFPRDIGHTQCTYLRRPAFTGAGHGSYRQHDNSPLYPFGHGLSYTDFTYDDIELSPTVIGPAGQLTVQVKVHNTGKRDGDEVVQCYLSDEVASVAPFLKKLCQFQRVHLKAGTSRTVTFTLKREDLAMWNAALEHVVEPGWFILHVGGSSIAGSTGRFEVRTSASGAAAILGAGEVLSRDEDTEVPD